MRSPSAHAVPSFFPYAATEVGNRAIFPGRPALSFRNWLLIDRESARLSGHPLVARSAAGFTTSPHGSLPNFLWAISSPRTVPGTPDASQPDDVNERSILPPAPRYIVGVDFPGARSR